MGTLRLRIGTGSGPLASANFRMLFLGSTVSALGNGLGPIAVTFLVLSAGHGPSGLAVVLAAGQIPTIALSLLGGVWADRFDRRRLLIISDVGRALCQGALFSLFITGSAELWHVVVLAIGNGIFGCVFVPGIAGLIPETVPRRALPAANALLSSAGTACAAAGMGVAGLLVALGGPAAAVAANSATFLISAGCLVRLQTVPRPHAASNGIVSDLRSGWGEVRSRRWMLVELLRSTLELPLVVAPFMLLGPIIATKRLGGAMSWSVIMMAFVVGTVLGPLLARWWRPRYPIRVCTVLMYLGALPSLLLALTDWTLGIALAEMVKGIAVGFFGALWATLLQREVPAGARSRVSSWDFTLTTGLMPVGYLLAAPLIGWLGTTTILLAGAGWVVVGVSVALLVPQLRNFHVHWDDQPTKGAEFNRCEEPVLRPGSAEGALKK